MLCLVCLTDNRDNPNQAVTYVQGSSVCREHVTAISDMMNLVYKLRELSQRLPASNGEAEIDVEKMQRQLTFLKAMMDRTTTKG